MAESRFAELDFTVGWCANCGREVLVWSDYGAVDPARCRCLHCDDVVTSQIRRAKGDELAERGYSLVEAGGCGSGGCGSGQCGRPSRANSEREPA